MTTTFRPQTAAASPRRTSERVTHIRPSRGWFDLQLDEAWRYRGLLATLVQRDIQVLYKQAFLGAAWAIIQPVLAVIIFTVVFGVLMKVPTPGSIPYPIFAFAAVLPWDYFAEGLRRGANGLVNEGDIVRKVFFPRMLIPLSGAIAPLLDFAIGLGVLLILMLAYGLAPSWHIVAVIPLALVAGLLALAVSLWLGPINVRYRDVKHTVPFIIQIWMYASPVVYPLEIVPEQWRWLYALNPMVGVIEGFRWAVTGQGVPDLTAMGVGLVLIVVLLLGGLVFFRKNEHSFADLI
ncbi:lipopolysaccharide transport system permease protein [Rhodospirillales bacterium URHD0017]|nr:lipopolysaccharide transport system permease protein [Rhodospirillales bacterium URHD0017]